MSAVYHYYSVYWANPYTSPPSGYERVVCIARIRSESGRGAGVCPRQVDDALRFWNRMVSGGAQEYGAGYAVSWHVARVDDAPPRRMSDEARYRIRRKRLEDRIRRRYPMFADEFISQEVARRPEYFGA